MQRNRPDRAAPGVMEELLATTFTVQRYVVTALILVFLATLATAGLVFGLFLRLRRSEIQTMVKIGDSHRRIAAFMGSQMLATMVVGALGRQSPDLAEQRIRGGGDSGAGPGLKESVKWRVRRV